MAGEPILIIDDNPINLKLEKILLAVEGYEIRTATDAEEALKLLEAFTPKLIMMDLQLPGMSGLELTTKLKSHPNYKQIIIIAITAYAMKGDRERALAAGCDGYVSKPIDTKTLPTVIANYLSEKQSS
jgi:two-component system cell cycle response regulator DivK